jgi:hypothetical protein
VNRAISGRKAFPSACDRAFVHAWPAERVVEEHIDRFNAHADNPSQLPNYRVARSQALLQSFRTSFLDFPDLADNKADPEIIARFAEKIRTSL